MKIGLTSQSEIKLNAVKSVCQKVNLNWEIIGYKTNSKVGEQPVEEETKQGAKNRIKDLLSREKDLDKIISIENGIFYEGKSWFDRAIIIVYDVKKDKEYVQISKPVKFPKEYVELAQKKGFKTTTVADIMVQYKIVKNTKDPHLDLVGISRQKILEDTIIELLRKII